MNQPNIPLIDLNEWRHEDANSRARVASEVDRALKDSGFLLLVNHGVAPSLGAGVRSAAKAFFDLPVDVKSKYATTVGGRGWLPSGKEANSYDGEDPDADKPDMKESYTIGRNFLSGDPELDSYWFKPNVWPMEVPDLELYASYYMDSMYTVYDELLRICGQALGLGTEWFIERTARGSRTLNINRYPSLNEIGAPQEGQFRVGPHTDWSIFTLLDRQVGYGGFQVEIDGEWFDAPFVEGALVINIGDLMARWTGDRWRSTRHRVLPPQDQAPDEELISLIQFCDANIDAVITPMKEPIGRNINLPTIEAGEYLRRRALAATVD